MSEWERRATTRKATKRAWQASVIGLLLLLVEAGAPVMAIPAFARKYRTSCQTCHIAFSALTPFGEAFRLNGYRFPAGTDASISKDEPVTLGSEGYKKLWPKSVWPGEIPGVPPVSFIASSEISNDRASKTTSFDGVGGSLELLSAGTLGDHASFFGNIAFEREAGETSTDLERFSIFFRPFASPAFQFRLGAFEPGLLLLSSHRSLIDADLVLLSEPVGDNAFAAEPAQRGIEFFGVPAHRILYNVGYVEGSDNALNNAKDVYARAAYKFGGLALDGTTSGQAEGLPTNPKPWREKSVTVSGFVYMGYPLLSSSQTILVNDPNTNIVTPVTTTIDQNDDFTMYGGDLVWNFQDLIVRAGGATRKDDSPVIGSPTVTDVRTKNKFAEIDWVALPWVIPAVRWESFESAGDKTEKVTLAVNMLVRANVKTFVGTDWLKEPGAGYATEEVLGGIVFGF